MSFVLLAQVSVEAHGHLEKKDYPDPKLKIGFVAWMETEPAIVLRKANAPLLFCLSRTLSTFGTFGQRNKAQTDDEGWT
jgi:hypothetical protein